MTNNDIGEGSANAPRRAGENEGDAVLSFPAAQLSVQGGAAERDANLAGQTHLPRSSEMRRTIVAVGSTNPAKVEAVRAAFVALWPEHIWEVRAVSVASGIAAQPMSDEESITGARNRARAALESGEAAFGVGLEGGLQQVGEWWFDSGWIVVRDREGREGIGSTAKIIVPPAMLELIQQGMELGDAVDRLFQQHNSKQAQGHFGLMTGGAITRAAAYKDGVLSALARFVHPHLFA